MGEKGGAFGNQTFRFRVVGFEQATGAIMVVSTCTFALPSRSNSPVGMIRPDAHFVVCEQELHHASLSPDFGQPTGRDFGGFRADGKGVQFVGR